VDENGRCSIHKVNPFSCDFELTKIILYPKGKVNHLTTKLYGRGWQYTRQPNLEVGALCKMTDITFNSILEVKRKLIRLQKWMDYFSIPSKIPIILKEIGKGNLFDNHLVIGENYDNQRRFYTKKFGI
jgi:hypothetical protein